MKTCGDCPWRLDRLTDEKPCGECQAAEWTCRLHKECKPRRAFRVVRDAYRRLASDFDGVAGMLMPAYRGIHAAAELQRGFMVAHYRYPTGTVIGDDLWEIRPFGEVDKLQSELSLVKAQKQEAYSKLGWAQEKPEAKP